MPEKKSLRTETFDSSKKSLFHQIAASGLDYNQEQAGIISTMIDRCKATVQGPIQLDKEETVLMVLKQLLEALPAGCLPSVALGQALHESNWFRTDIYFGIKARQQDVASGQAKAFKTREYFGPKSIDSFKRRGRYLKELEAPNAKGLTLVEIEDFFFLDRDPAAQFTRYYDLMKRVHPGREQFLPQYQDGKMVKASDPLGFLRYICRPGAAYSTDYGDGLKDKPYPEDVYDGYIVPLQLWRLDIQTTA